MHAVSAMASSNVSTSVKRSEAISESLFSTEKESYFFKLVALSFFNELLSFVSKIYHTTFAVAYITCALEIDIKEWSILIPLLNSIFACLFAFQAS